MTDAVRERVALKPCPFCGGAAQTHNHSLEYTVSVRCIGCAAGMPFVGLDEAEATAAWNQRAISEREQALVTAMRELLPSKLCGESWNLPDTEHVTISINFGKLERARASLAAYGESE